MIQTFQFTQPIWKNSQADIPIYNSENEHIGSIKRVFKSRSSFLLDLLFDSWFVHLNVYDQSNRLVYEICEKMNWSIKTLFRSIWLYHSHVLDENHFAGTIMDETLLRTNPKFKFDVQQEPFYIATAIGDSRTRIYNQHDQIVATIDRINLLPKKVTITINEKSLVPIHMIAAIYYLLDLRR